MREYVRSFPWTAGTGVQKDSKGSSLALILHIFFNMFVFVYSNYVHRTNTSTHSLPASIAKGAKSFEVCSIRSVKLWT